MKRYYFEVLVISALVGLLVKFAGRLSTSVPVFSNIEGYLISMGFGIIIGFISFYIYMNVMVRHLRKTLSIYIYTFLSVGILYFSLNALSSNNIWEVLDSTSIILFIIIEISSILTAGYLYSKLEKYNFSLQGKKVEIRENIKKGFRN